MTTPDIVTAETLLTSYGYPFVPQRQQPAVGDAGDAPGQRRDAALSERKIIGSRPGPTLSVSAGLPRPVARARAPCLIPEFAASRPTDHLDGSATPCRRPRPPPISSTSPG